MNITISGLAALVIQIGFIVVFSTPIWLAARVVGADNPTLLRSAASLLLGTFIAVVCLTVGPVGFLLIPLAYLLSFKFVLGTSFGGAFLLAVVAAAGYAAMVHFIGGGVNFAPHATAV
jgi:hypothetical protein